MPGHRLNQSNSRPTVAICMQLLSLSLPTAAENVALDEALLETAEAAPNPYEVLRLWTTPAPAVVVGRASKVAGEVNLDACRAADVPVIRRCSGGCAIVAGPGCLMYSLVLSFENYPSATNADGVNQLVLQRIIAAIAAFKPDVGLNGSSDLTLGVRKFSGNSIRLRRRHVLFHGTLLHDFDLSLVSQLLNTPPREPDYRSGREHADFITNLHIPAGELTQSIIMQWAPESTLHDWPEAKTAELVREKYSQDDWNFRL